MKAIVTIRLEKNPSHNPHNKQSGKCPVNNWGCSDITGEHHSYVECGEDEKQILEFAKQKFKHITRIEIIEK